MSYNLSLQTNNAEIQELISIVNALPDAGGVELPTLTAPASEAEVFEGYEYIDQKGTAKVGIFTIESELNEQDELLAELEEILNIKSAAGETNPVLQSKTVTPTTSSQTVTADSGYDGLKQVTVNAMPTATQTTPSITVDSNGLITASATQTAGYVSAGTKSATKQLITKAAATITPTTTSQVAVSAGTYVTGDITVGAVESSSSGSDTRFVDCAMGLLTEVNDDTITKVRQYAFSHNSSLVTANLPNLTSIEQSVFRYCSNLEAVYCPKLSGNLPAYVFQNCSKLKTVNIPNVTGMTTSAFQGCQQLERLELGNIGSISGTNTFKDCTSLTVLIIRQTRTNITTLGNVNSFTGTPIESGTGYIYVPSALLDAYKTATNWSAYASQIRAIEDYPEICE